MSRTRMIFLLTKVVKNNMADNNQSQRPCPVRGLTPRGQAVADRSKLLLKNYPTLANLSLGDAREVYRMIEHKTILDQYTFPKKAGKDGYYRIYVKDATKKAGRKQLAARSLDELREKVILFELGISGHATKNFHDVFQIVQSERLKYIKDPEKKLSAQNTVGRNHSAYKRFFEGTEFEKMPIDMISKKDLENVIYMNLKRYDLRKKAFESLKSILRAVFALAYNESWISDNIYLRMDFQKFAGMLMPDTPIDKRVHSTSDLQRMLSYIHEYQKRKPSYIPAYALEMQILAGLRRGEVPPLLLSDIHDDYIDITKEQLTVKKNAVNEKEYCTVVNHTKNYRNRYFPRTDSINDLLARLQLVHDKYYPTSIYLFPADNENGIITNNTVYNFYRRMCKKLDIKIDSAFIKGTHSFRRNAITDVVNAANGNTIMASQLFGNTPEVAQKNYYTGVDLQRAKDVVNSRKIN